MSNVQGSTARAERGPRMWNPMGQNRSVSSPIEPVACRQSRHRHAMRPRLEMLEDRQLMAAFLAPLSNITVPAQLGYQVPLDGSGNIDPAQTYTVTSDN